MKRRLRNAAFLASLMASANVSLAQVSAYNFSSVNGSYVEETGGTILFQGDPKDQVEDESAAVTIPFLLFLKEGHIQRPM